MKRLILSLTTLSALTTIGCVTMPKYRPPSDYLLSTDMSVTDVVKSVKAKLTESKYLASRENLDAGLLVFEPRQFAFDKKGVRSLVQQVIQIRHEGGSVKVHITYTCNYTGADEVPFKQCFQKDKVLEDKIKRVEKALISSMRDVLVKHKETAPATKAPDPSAANPPTNNQKSE